MSHRKRTELVQNHSDFIRHFNYQISFMHINNILKNIVSEKIKKNFQNIKIIASY